MVAADDEDEVAAPEEPSHRISRRVARQLDRDAEDLTCDWWETDLSVVMRDLARSGGFVVALAGIAEAIQKRHDPLWVVGDTTATSAHTVAWEWLDAGVEPTDVGTWLLAGCWDPRTAKALADAGVDPDDLIDDDGMPRDRVETASGEILPAAQAAADGQITPADVAAMIRSRRPTT